MKIYIGKPNNWFGPYQLAETLCFWAKEEKDEYGFPQKPDWVHNFGEFLAHGFNKETEEEKKRFLSSSHDRHDRSTTWLYKFLTWIDSKKPSKRYIKIDYWDTWSMDHTLAPIILPMLKQLKATKHGSGFVDLEDVPEELRSNTHEEWDDQKCFDFYHAHKVEEGECDIHARWDWVLDEMIFAFEHLVDHSWEDKYSSGNWDTYSEPCAYDEDGKPRLYVMKHGPNHTHKTDFDGLQKEWQRIDNGLRLFGKYFRNLWD